MKKLLRIIALISSLIYHAYGEENNGTEEWMNASPSGLGGLFGCIEAPKLLSIKESSKKLNLTSSGKWVATKTYVQANKMLKIQWDFRDVETVPQKYLVLYRIDPRFRAPQVFIQQYDYSKEKYISDFYQYNFGLLLQYQKDPEMTFSIRLLRYINYFYYIERPKIPVKKNDVINITLDGVGKYFAANSEMQVDFRREPSNPAIIYTESAGMDNKIIYTDIPAWCSVAGEKSSNSAICGDKSNCTIPPECSSEAGKLTLINSHCNPPNGSPPTWCATDSEKTAMLEYLCDPDRCAATLCDAPTTSNCNGTTYRSTIDLWAGLVGSPISGPFEKEKPSIVNCAEGANGRNNTPICYYDKGRGMHLSVGPKTIKPTSESFVRSPYNHKDFFYYKSDADGDLNFSTDWQISGMFSGGINQYLDMWVELDLADYNDFNSYLAGFSTNAEMNFMHFGRYGMQIEIGNSEAIISAGDLGNVKVEYIIMEDGAPTDTTIGVEAGMDYKTNANTSGYIWLRTINNSAGLGGSINVKMANYTGSTWFSDIVYNKLIKPVRENINNLTKMLYTKFVTNPTMQNIARGLMTVYIIIYGLSYLAGATQITATDLVMRIVKMGVIVALFSPTSWNFFNENCFRIFIEGSDYLLTNVVGITSQVGNIFGFIDPIFDKYTNGTTWGLLFIQLLMIHNGLCFFAMMTIYSILLYFRAVIEVILSYCLAFVGLAVMISLAPFFITFLLFEQTKSMFTSWISTMFSYMMQPTILLIFFLLIDQMMTEHIANVVVRACWGILIPFEFGLDLTHMGIPLKFSFTIPFLPGIPFFVSQVKEVNSLGELVNGHGTFLVIATSSLLFMSYCKMSQGLVDYVTLVVQNLTNVVAARQDGKLQGSGANPVKDITNDMGKAISPITNSLKGIGGFAKEKIFDQKIKNRGPSIAQGGVGTGTGSSNHVSGSIPSGSAGLPQKTSAQVATGTTKGAPEISSTKWATKPLPKPPGIGSGSPGHSPTENPGVKEPQVSPKSSSPTLDKEQNSSKGADSKPLDNKTVDLKGQSPGASSPGTTAAGGSPASPGQRKSFLAATRAKVPDISAADLNKPADAVGNNSSSQPQTDRNDPDQKALGDKGKTQDSLKEKNNFGEKTQNGDTKEKNDPKTTNEIKPGVGSDNKGVEASRKYNLAEATKNASIGDNSSLSGAPQLKAEPNSVTKPLSPSTEELKPLGNQKGNIEREGKINDSSKTSQTDRVENTPPNPNKKGGLDNA